MREMSVLIASASGGSSDESAHMRSIASRIHKVGIQMRDHTKI